MRFSNLHKLLILALKEDIGKGDVTTDVLFSKPLKIEAKIIARDKGIVCGLPIVTEIFKTLDQKTSVLCKAREGSLVKHDQVVCAIKGDANKILKAERTALNFLSRLSGIATMTKNYTDKIKPHKTKIMDTRKTTPGLREFEKYAVKTGGGYNHRMGLYDQVLIKDNHLAAIGDRKNINRIVALIRKKVKKHIKVEVEVQNLKEFKETLPARPDIIMLDNMKNPDIKKAVKIRGKRKIMLEASGGVNLETVRSIAKTGVDMISIGGLTHSVKSLDFSLEIA